MLIKTSKILAVAIGVMVSGNAIAAPQWLQSAAGDYSPIQLAANSFGNTGGSTKQKICTNTYQPDGTRCTFCYYTTQPGSGSTTCIKIKTPTQSSGPATRLKL
jgi:hypothetical protein